MVRFTDLLQQAIISKFWVSLLKDMQPKLQNITTKYYN